MTPIKFCDQLLDIWRVLLNEAGASIWELSLKKRLVSLFGSVCSKAKCRAAKKLADIKMIGERPPTEEARSPYMRKRFTA